MDKTDKRIKLFKQGFLSEGYNLYIDKNMSNACAFSLVFAWIWYKWNGFFVLKITSSSFYTANEWPLNRPNKYHGKKSIATRHCWVVKRQHSIFLIFWLTRHNLWRQYTNVWITKMLSCAKHVLCACHCN